MITSKPHPSLDSFNTTTLEPIYDTYKGKPVYIPQGYTVKVTGSFPTNNNTTCYKLLTIDNTGKVVKASAFSHQLDLPSTDTSPVVSEPVGPLVPRIYQEYGITFLLYKGAAILADAPGVGKGHPDNTNILTPVGWKQLKDIQVGDKVIGSQGTPVLVTGVFNRGILPVYRVRFSDRSSVLCDADHIWHVTPHGSGVRQGYSRQTKDIRNSLHLRYNIPIVKPIQFEYIEQKVDPYLLGVLLSDGSFRGNTISFCNPDSRILHEVKKTGINLSQVISAKTATYDIVDNSITKNSLQEYGLMKLYSHEKFIPDEYKFSSVEQRLAILQGLMDTDGWVQGYSTSCFGTSSERLADDVLFLIQSLGGTVKCTAKNPSYQSPDDEKWLVGKVAYQLVLSLPDGINPFRARKDDFIPHEKYKPSRIIHSVTPEGDANVICISVDAIDQLYVTEHCIVTHNTIQALEAATRAMDALEQQIDPLALCYTNDLSNLHDDKNTHPTERPEWVMPKPNWYTKSVKVSNTSTINVSTHVAYKSEWTHNPITVIVAPNHLCSMWFKAIRRQYPNVDVVLATGSGSTRKERLDAIQPGARFYIVNYEMMRKVPDPPESAYEEVDVVFNTFTLKEKRLKATYKSPETFIERLLSLNPVCVIFDECHRLKSAKSKQAQAAAEFSTHMPYRFLLSATPIKREADDLFWQLHITDPIEFNKDEYSSFVYKYCFFKQTTYDKSNIQLRDNAKRRFWFNRIASLEQSADYDAQQAVAATKKDSKKYNTSFTNPNINGYILGRSYKDVGLYLPQVIPANIPVQMDANIRKVYEQLKSTYRASFDMLGEELDISSLIGMMHSLRILTACPNKFEAVKQLVEEDSPAPHVIFCEYKPSGEFLASVLNTTFISGEIPEAERESLIQDLLAEGKPVVGMGRVIGTGINALADCNTIINFEADYTPGERTQRIGRVQRFSPNRPEGAPILLFDVWVTDSIDEHVYEVQRNRARSIRDIISVELGIK